MVAKNLAFSGVGNKKRKPSAIAHANCLDAKTNHRKARSPITVQTPCRFVPRLSF
uniref:Uncharacterized protein n=1 Tax=Tetraselmis sp. GSL018 TaxID=582737 RepID=A0A061QNS4_9CHLO